MSPSSSKRGANLNQEPKVNSDELYYFNLRSSSGAEVDIPGRILDNLEVAEVDKPDVIHSVVMSSLAVVM